MLSSSLVDLSNIKELRNQYHVNTTLSFSNKHKSFYNKYKKQVSAVVSLFMGVGTGLAMMPIFNEELEHLDNYGIHVHNNKTTFILSTCNTFFLISSFVTFFTYKYFNNFSDNETHHNTKALVGLSCTASILPLTLLWNIELNNQEVTESKGFSPFIAWATFTSLPLIVFKCLKSYHELTGSLYKERDILDSLGANIFINGISAIALISRGITYTHLTKELLNELGADNSVALPTSIVLSGICANAVVAICEYYSLKDLFLENTQNITLKKAIGASLTTIEGAWFTLPIISSGLEATQDINVLLKGILFTSLFLSHTNLEAKGLYEEFNFSNPEETNIQTIGEYGTTETDI